MYNRYIPQPDGSFCRKQFPESPRKVPEESQYTKKASGPEPECPKEASMSPVAAPERCKHCQGCRKKPHQTVSETSSGANSLLSQLLPKDFDTGDLMVILLLLLMAGDCPENQNNALLTLALYLFL